MAQPPSPIDFEDIPLEDARHMGRGPRLEPMLYETLRKKIHSLADQAARIRSGPEIRPARMKNSILRIARELKVPVTIRKVPVTSSASRTGRGPRLWISLRMVTG